jgi:hypothetical protein
MAAGSHIIRIDRSKPLRVEPHTGHNRWHPDIPRLRVDPGERLPWKRVMLRWGHYARFDAPDLHRAD